MQTIPNLETLNSQIQKRQERAFAQLKDDLDKHNVIFKALVFSGDQLVDSLIFDSLYINKTFSEVEINQLFSTYLKKYFSNTNIDDLDNLIFHKNLPTNMEKTIYSQEISGYLKSGSKELERFKHVEEPYINLVLEQFYN